MLPMGGPKGAALALMVEVLAAGLTGARLGWEASSFFDAAGSPPGIGQFLLVIDGQAIDPHAPGRIAALAAAVEGEADARLPGRRRQALRARIAAEGIPLDPRLRSEIEALGR